MQSTDPASNGFRHPDRWNSVPVPEAVALRAYTNVDKLDDGCWISRYSVASHGYAQIGWSIRNRPDAGGRKIQMVLAHRAAWTHVNGQVPLGMTIDHLCKVRRCVNPDHMRLLPNYENARRTDGKDWPMGFCANGHPNSERVPTTVLGKRRQYRSGSICRICRGIYTARGVWRARNGAEPFPHHLLLASEKGHH